MTDDSKRSAKIKYAAPTMVVHMDYDIAVKLPEVNAEFTLSEESLKAVIKACTSFTAPEIAFIAENGKLKLSTFNSSQPTGDSFEVEIGEIDDTFTIIINVSNLSMLMDTYDVKICYKGILEFTSKTENNELTYWLAASEKSKVN